MIPGLFPTGMEWCIAGGFAACPALATDIDVWVYGLLVDDMDRVRAELIAGFEAFCATNNVNRPIWPEKRYLFTPQTEESSFLVYEQESAYIQKVGVVYLPRSSKVKPIHVMVTNAPDPGSLLTGFDVSTHAVAIDKTGRVWTEARWTPPQIVPIELSSNPKTPERMQRIATRFGHEKTLLTKGA